MTEDRRGVVDATTSGQGPASSSLADPTEPAAGERIGPYEVERRVARGGMATVFAVTDTRDGRHVALKLLLPMTHAEEAKTRFRREFRALSRLQHPNVLQVFEWGLRGDRPWFTMELVEGRDLRDEVEAWADLAPSDRFVRAQAVLVQAARALAYIHDRGLVHRDITPGNIMVRPDGVVKLMDFGVVKDLGTDLTQVGEVVGTVAYISPEQIAGDAIDARADLYSLGAVLYLMLTGRRPFQAHTLQGYLEKHLHEAPKPPHEVDPAVPPHLDAICLRLLAKVPSERYASAAHLLHALGDTWGMDESDGRWPPRAVGRTLVRAQLRDAIDELLATSPAQAPAARPAPKPEGGQPGAAPGLHAQGRPGAAVLVTGSAGAGKSRLLDMVDTYARRRGLTVARGRCRVHDRPFGAFVGVYRELATESSPPLLRAALEGEDDGVTRERYPVVAAFRELVVARAPCVVILDDIERADAATVELLEYLIRNTLDLQHERVLYVLGEETETISAVDRTLMAAGPVERVELGPLDAQEVEELVVSMLPNDAASHALARRLHAESNGSPAFIADMLRGLHDEGLIVREGRKWRLNLDASEITRSRLPMPASLRAALVDRLAPLSPKAREVGRVLAIARRRLDLDALVEAAPLSEDDVIDGLDQLVEAGVVEERRQDEAEQVELSHHRFRDVLLDELEPEERRRRHQKMGEILERQYRYRPAVVVEELAYHFEQAGLAPKAYAYLQMTATRHLHRSLYDEALGFLDRALQMEPTARPLMLLDDADRRLAEVHLERSLAHHHLGQWREALADAHHAETLARDVRDARLQSRVSGLLGNQLRNAGAIDEAESALRAALAKANEVGDASLRPMPLYELGAILWGRGDLGEAEKLWKEALATAQRVGDERAQGFGYNGLGILAICRGDAAEARRQLEQSAELFERLGLLPALSIARVNLVELYLSTGILKKALALADRTVAQAREVHHSHAIAFGLAWRAQVLLALARGDEAFEAARESLRLVRQLGTAEDEVVTLTTLVRVHLDRAAHHEGPAQGTAYSQALDQIRDLMPVLADHDSEGIAPQIRGLHAQALAGLGRADDARRVLGPDVEERQWPHVQVRTDLAKGVAWRMLGEKETARRVLQRALATAEANGYRFWQLVAHHELSRVVEDENMRARHQRVAGALARSLAANLPPQDAKRFLATEWGGGTG